MWWHITFFCYFFFRTAKISRPIKGLCRLFFLSVACTEYLCLPPLTASRKLHTTIGPCLSGPVSSDLTGKFRSTRRAYRSNVVLHTKCCPHIYQTISRRKLKLLTSIMMWHKRAGKLSSTRVLKLWTSCKVDSHFPSIAFDSNRKIGNMLQYSRAYKYCWLGTKVLRFPPNLCRRKEPTYRRYVI